MEDFNIIFKEEEEFEVNGIKLLWNEHTGDDRYLEDISVSTSINNTTIPYENRYNNISDMSYINTMLNNFLGYDTTNFFIFNETSDLERAISRSNSEEQLVRNPEVDTSSLSSFEYKVGDTFDKCFCTNDYKNGEKVTKLDCGHTFHTDCIKEWLMYRQTCPICRAEVKL